jgi:hypothetical protein
MDEIVKELDEDPPETSSDAAAQHCMEQPNPYLEAVETREEDP